MQKIALGLVGIAIATNTLRLEAALSGCASTPEAAILLTSGATKGRLSTDMHGFRVEATRWDSFLRQGWVTIQSCEHPEQPSFFLRTTLVNGPIFNGRDELRRNLVVATVRTGDLVRLWKSDTNAHIEMMAMAEESGRVGARVRVRVVPAEDLKGQSSQPLYLAGIVRGAADVEITQ